MKKLNIVLAVVVCLALLAGCTMVVDPNFQPLATSQQVEPGAGQWQTWVLESVDEVRPAPPPDQTTTLAEIAELKALVGQRDDAAAAQVAYWDAGSPSYRWIEIALNQFKTQNIGNPRIMRGLSLMNVAIYDAMVAAWDAKTTYQRPRPSTVDPTLKPLVAVPNSPSYPAEHAVAAGAAAAILSYLYPDDAAAFAAKAEEAAHSRLLAGVQYPSDVEAGLALGRQVAEQVIARAMADGTDVVWDGTMPSGAGYWTGEKPLEPLAGSWLPWVLESGDQLRPPAPYAYDSPELAAEIEEIKTVTHTWQMDGRIIWWQTFDAVYNFYYDFASRHIFEHHLDTNPPQAARIYALMSIADYDSLIACWDAKYTYWLARPYQVDTTIKTYFPFPPHPSYPAGHACTSGAIAATLASLFPEDAAYINSMAEDAGNSRIWGGIHYRQDVEVGLELGTAIADLVVTRADEMVQP